MKAILAKIAAVLAAMPRLVWERVRIGGDWVMRLVAKPAMPMPAPEPVENESDLVEQEWAEQLAAIREIATLLQAGRYPAPELAGQLSEMRLKWLGVLPDEMLQKVAQASDEALKAHVLGRKAIRGVLRADREAVDAWTAAPDEIPGSFFPKPSTGLQL
jgi:hypothetical protein